MDKYTYTFHLRDNVRITGETTNPKELEEALNNGLVRYFTRSWFKRNNHSVRISSDEQVIIIPMDKIVAFTMEPLCKSTK